MLLMIDNYDSFTYNLVQYLGELGQDLKVYRNNKITIAEIEAMRPERIVVGEIRSGEAIDMLQAMNTGHDGSLTTLHANNPREAIGRIETMSLMGGLEIPLKVIREQIAKAVDLIVQQARLNDGSRKITYITEISGMEGESVVTQDIFKYDESLGADGRPYGMKPTGLRPFFTPRLEQHGFKLPPEIFGGAAGDMYGGRRR